MAVAVAQTQQVMVVALAVRMAVAAQAMIPVQITDLVKALLARFGLFGLDTHK
jgi:hypothetical protein